MYKVDNKEKAKEFKKKYGDKAIDVVQEVIDYITDEEPDYEGKSIGLQELQNEIRSLNNFEES